jgi:phosphoribosylanthranilate isomerase
MMVKICGITNREDALAAIEGGAAALGFNFFLESPRYIAPERAAELFEELPPGVWKVGLFVNEPPEKVAAAARRLALDVVQLHGDAPVPDGIRVWKALAVTPGFRHEELERYSAEAFVLDTPAGMAHGGTGKTYDWALVAGARKKIILAGGLEAGNVRLAIRTAKPWGVDACSRLESSPGKKDHKKMAEFLKAALSGEPI